MRVIMFSLYRRCAAHSGGGPRRIKVSFAAEIAALRIGPALEALLRNNIRTADEAGIALIDAAYACQLGADIITAKHITGFKLCDAMSVAALVEELELEPARHYFHLIRLYAVVKHIEHHRQLPATNLVPVSVWMSTQDKYKQHVKVFDDHGVVELMLEHIEPLCASFILGLPPKTIRELKTDYRAAHQKRACIAYNDCGVLMCVLQRRMRC